MMRIKGLDFLRGIAILLVLFRHSLHTSILQSIGWIGVDLFFVLSGFLVTSLLCKEYKERNTIDIKTFFIRRGLKIYPSFYFFIIVYVTIKFLFKKEFYPIEELLAEIFYLQNYLPGIWLHTWSLAVEEHFYILLCVLAWLVSKFKVLENRKLIITILLLLLVTSFIIRWQVCLQHRREGFMFFKTHLRIEGLLWGLTLAYLIHFARVVIANKYRLFVFGIAGLLISPAFVFEGGNFWMNTIGITMLSIGFTLLVWMAINDQFFTQSLFVNALLFRKIYSGICLIGIHSYSIYIWHLLAQRVTFFIFSGYTILGTLAYITIAIGIGTFFSYLIERPFLNFREKLVPRREYL